MPRSLAEQAQYITGFGEITDDLSDHRPGALAARELGVVAPLREAGMSKDDVRRYAREAGAAIVAISVGAGVFNNWIKMKQATKRNVDQDRELSDVKADIEKLQDRVRVLEKLAVDGDRALSAEIAKLR